MAWIITKDHLDDGNDITPSRVGVRSAGYNGDGSELPVRFKLYDDDGELYYEGRMSQEDLEGDETKAFAPLDFASADAGATTMKYFDLKKKEWLTL